MPSGEIVVMLVERSWAVKWADSEDAIAYYGNQTEAEQIARQLARREKANLVIHGRDGRVVDSTSYAARASS